jgi:hypothetical protein
MVMGKNIIVSEETIRDLLEAHASLCAWYYELSAGLRAANGAARTPDDATRAAFVDRLAHDYPEIASVAKSIRVPRMFVPAPPSIVPPMRPAGELEGEQSTLIEPALARRRDSGTHAAVSMPISDEPTLGEGSTPPGAAPPISTSSPSAPIAPPAIVIPSKVKYDP